MKAENKIEKNIETMPNSEVVRQCNIHNIRVTKNVDTGEMMVGETKNALKVRFNHMLKG